jgi:hypothetical protein
VSIGQRFLEAHQNSPGILWRLPESPWAVELLTAVDWGRTLGVLWVPYQANYFIEDRAILTPTGSIVQINEELGPAISGTCVLPLGFEGRPVLYRRRPVTFRGEDVHAVVWPPETKGKP